MKWYAKYHIDLEDVHKQNINGATLSELSTKYGVPKTTLNRYLRAAGYEIQMNRKGSKPYHITKEREL